MSERVQASHGDLSLEEIVEALPGTGDLMALVGTAWWKCAYAARGGNWELAAYFARRVRGLQRRLALVRPKYEADLARFEATRIEPLLVAADRRDRAAFERAFADATDEANELHAKWGKSYIRWVLPDEAPRDLDLGWAPARAERAQGSEAPARAERAQGSEAPARAERAQGPEAGR